MIRPATPDDMVAMIALGARMHAESRYRVLSFSPAKLRTTLQFLLSAQTGFLWVAEVHGEVVGGLAAMCAPHWASDDLMATDLALFMAPEHRGGMAVARLVKQYRRWARAAGAKLVDLGVTTGVHTEETAQLLERLEFRRCGVVLEG